MDTKFLLKIENPCEADYNQMTPNSSGAFCKLCAKDVVDLTGKTNSEIAHLIQNSKNLCVKITEKQLNENYQYPKINNPIQNLKYASAIAASLLLTSPVFGQEKKPTPQNQSTNHVHNNLDFKGDISPYRIVTIKGKILDNNTGKPFLTNSFPNFQVLFNGGKSFVMINQKTGEYEISVELMFSSNEVIVYFKTSNDLQCNKTVKINQKQIKNGIYNLDIKLNPDEFELIVKNNHILGKILKHN